MVSRELISKSNFPKDWFLLESKGRCRSQFYGGVSSEHLSDWRKVRHEATIGIWFFGVGKINGWFALITDEKELGKRKCDFVENDSELSTCYAGPKGPGNPHRRIIHPFINEWADGLCRVLSCNMRFCAKGKSSILDPPRMHPLPAQLDGSSSGIARQ